MIISIILPDVPVKKQDNYQPKLLGGLIGTYGHTVNYYPQSTIPVKASDKNLFIWLGAKEKFNGFKNKYSKHGISVGYDNTQAWINVDNPGIRRVDSFCLEYNILASSFKGRLDQKGYEGFYKGSRLMEWIDKKRPDNIVNIHSAKAIYSALKGKITGKKITPDYGRWLFDQNEPAEYLPHFLPIQNKYAYGIMLFVRDYLEDFLKPYSDSPM